MSETKKYPKQIRLHSRYSDVHNSLQRVDADTTRGVYKLITSGHYVRCLFDYDPSKVTAIDPEGGPMLGVGDAITPELCINKIWHSKEHQGYLLELI